jgi:hypothetical protein
VLDARLSPCLPSSLARWRALRSSVQAGWRAEL